MSRKDFNGASAGADYALRRGQSHPTVKCARIGCGLQSCMREVPFRTEDAALLDRSTLVRNFERGEEIFSEGDSSAGLYCVRSGVVLLTYKDALRADKAVRMVGPSDLMGYRSLFAEEPHGTSAEALTACHVCFFAKNVILRLADNYPVFSRMLFRELARDKGLRRARFMREPHLPIRIRFADFLRVMEQRYGVDEGDGGVCVQLPIMRRQIASVLSARPESVARAITELEREGLAVFDGRRVSIPDPGELYRIVDGGTVAADSGTLT